MRSLGFSSLLLCSVLAVAGCDGEPTVADDGGAPMGRLGVPDDAHGPPTDDDIDGDGVPNGMDSCPSLANADQRAVCDYPTAPPEPTGDVIADGLARLNWHRSMLGLPPVTEADTFSEGCRLHLSYLQQLSAELGSPQLSHSEDLSKPYASEEGNRAGIDSVLSLGRSDIGDAVDGWMNTLYHRLPLIHPGLQEVGIAYAEEGSYACVQYRRGTDASAVAPHPIRWPPPDVMQTDRTFTGNESPCPTAEDPLGGGACPPSAAIATLGLHGHGALSDVEAEILRLDTGESLPLFRTYHANGPSPHEMMGYLEGTVALVPEPESELARALYEVRVRATVGGEAEEYRWRFHVQGGLNEDVECDLFGPQGDFDSAISIDVADIEGKVCDAPDFYRLSDEGSFDVTLHYDPARDLDLVIYGPDREPISEVTGPETPARIERVEGMSYLEVRSASGAMGPYTLSVELAEE
ncbi:MAG TPA: CAP domain-containing protein [Sandaracinaceae bacterium LLY-WYZ-13_1]|nr:CAP domain-containing protein [Sandaracinaceae bacterium LLY-WYZ-13_1]